jgi:cold shock CspA family protein
MEPVLKKGKLIDWKDERGFGFIKSDDVDKQIFLHISVLNRSSRRPKNGDIILYKLVVEPNGKLRATRASIQGDTNQSFTTNSKPRKQGLLTTILGVIIMPIVALSSIEFSPRSYPSPIAFITKPGCIIKGNISIETGKKVYHLPGMEDYESTVIDRSKGEKWFCTEPEAISNDWSKAPR